jgi:HTH-type transcriptional regulator/antitoxin HigA
MDKPKYKVSTEAEHAEMLLKVDALMRKGEKNVTEEESEEIRAMGLALQEYERVVYAIPGLESLDE